MKPNIEEDLYRIGTVASLTGISVERLRAWERRYDLAPAHKSGKTRFYSKPQLTQLKLIKHLTDTGHPISSLATLSTEQLQQRLEAQTQKPRLFATHKPKVGLVGSNLQILAEEQDEGALRVDLVGRWANMDALADDQHGAREITTAFLQLPVITEQAIDLAENIFNTSKIFVLYRFATAQQISQIQARGIETLKWPLTWAEIEHLAISAQGLAGNEGWAPKTFSDEELVAIAATDEDPSQCPAHLINIITQLNDLATYTAQQAAGLTTHHQAAQQMSQARAHLEATLEIFIGDAET